MVIYLILKSDYESSDKSNYEKLLVFPFSSLLVHAGYLYQLKCIVNQNEKV